MSFDGRFTVKRGQQHVCSIDGKRGSNESFIEHWLSTGAGIGGLAYTLIITKSHISIELGISTSSKEKNKAYFKKLLKSKDAVEQAFGSELDWEELPDNKMSRVKFELQDVNLFNESHWDRMNEFFIEYLPKFESAFKPFIKNLK